VKPGAIFAEGVSRRFRVYPQRNVTLKDAILRRRQLRREEIWALRDVSLAIEPGEAVGIVGRNGSGKTTLLRLIAGIFQPTGGRLEVAGEVGSLLGLGAGFHPDFTGRENVYMNGAIHGLSRSYVHERLEEIVSFAELEEFFDVPVRTYSSGMYMRLGFALATHLDPDILLLDEVFAVGDEAFQRKCFGKIFEFKQRGGTIVFVSHDAASVERLCERAVLLREGAVDFDGTTRDAIMRYHALLADEQDPAERGAGLREWGSREVRIAAIVLTGADGDERRQFASGEPLSVRLRIVADAPLPPPRLRYELRDESNLLLASAMQDTGELGFDGSGECTLRFDVAELPLADGRFHLRFGLADASGEHLYHWLDDAATFVVWAEGADRGLLRLEGRWSREEMGATAELRTG
jgi:ABC-type polysaccharide/polyol phosphate transport system ATPase subunit